MSLRLFAWRILSSPGDETERATLSEYKSRGAVKADDLRRRREEQQVEIRRQKREENISKRRNVFSTTSADSDDESTAAGWGDSAVSLKSRLSLVSFITCLHSSPKT